MKYTLLTLLLILCSCIQAQKTEFPAEVLNDTFITLEEQKITFNEILNTYKGNTIVIDVWANWCRDCIKGMPKLKELQEAYPEVTFLFLSMDKSVKSWKSGLKKYDLKGHHYFLTTGWEGNFSKGINLDWIPRYMVVDAKGNISLYRAIKADDKAIKNALDSL